MPFITEPSQKSDHSKSLGLGLTLEGREHFAKSLVDWFVKLLKYFRYEQWTEKKPRNKTKKMLARKRPMDLQNFQLALVGDYGIRSMFHLQADSGPFGMWEDMQEYLETIIKTLQNALRELEVPEQSKRFNEILAGIRSAL